MAHEAFGKKLYLLFIWHFVCYAAIKLTLLAITHILYNFIFCLIGQKMTERYMLKFYTIITFLSFFSLHFWHNFTIYFSSIIFSYVKILDFYLFISIFIHLMLWHWILIFRIIITWLLLFQGLYRKRWWHRNWKTQLYWNK